MGRKTNRPVLLAALAVFLLAQSLCLANISQGKDKGSHEFIVKSGTSVSGIAQQLADEGFIRIPYLFVALSIFYKGKLIAGEYELTPDMGMFHILRKMAHGERNIYTLRIVEGNNIFNVADSAEKAHIMKAGDFLRILKDRSLVTALGIQAESLEGYLAPDTYFYSREIDAEKLVEKITQRTLAYFSRDDVKRRMGELRLSVHDVLTLASMIEREAKQRDEKPVISAVFHNRLRKGMSLDCDPTVLYTADGVAEGPIRKSDLTAHTPYNTYTLKGLPKGPICNPDKSSISAVLNPARVDFLYFVSKNDGTHVFSKDMKDHNRFVTMYQRTKQTKKQ
ncbi:MAG TPA: endolytic transglycosylase MltG [Syntrophorhabdaceae bacterium]|jgi:UPF0755 protein